MPDEYVVVKANLGLFYDDDSKRLLRGDELYLNTQGGKYPPVHNFKPQQTPFKLNIFPGGEVCYNTKKYTVGLAFSYNKTYYTYSYYENRYDGGIPNGSIITKVSGQGNASLSNNMFKFIYGFNFNTKFGLNLYVQPLNPELRFYAGKYLVTEDTYYHYVYKTGPLINTDSSIFVSSETKNIKFVNYKTNVNFSIAFPTTIGLEQRFKIGKLRYVAGASATISIIEVYLIFRAHIGICFGGFRNNKKS